MTTIYTSLHKIVKIEIYKTEESTFGNRKSYSTHIRFYSKTKKEEREEQLLELTIFSDNPKAFNIVYKNLYR